MGNTISTLSSCCIRADSSSEGTEECNLSLGSCLSAGTLGDFSDPDISDQDSGFELRGWLRCGRCQRVDLDLCSGTAATWPPRRLLSGTWTPSPSSSASRSPEEGDEIVDTAPLFGRSPSFSEGGPGSGESAAGEPLAEGSSGSSVDPSASSPGVSESAWMDEWLVDDESAAETSSRHNVALPPVRGAEAAGLSGDDAMLAAIMFQIAVFTLIAGCAEHNPDELNLEVADLGDDDVAGPQVVGNELPGEDEIAAAEALLALRQPRAGPEVVQVEEDSRWHNGYIDDLASDESNA